MKRHQTWGDKGDRGDGTFVTATVAASEQTISGSPANLATPGPEVTVTVGDSGLIEVFAKADMTAAGRCGVRASDGTSLGGNPGALVFSTTPGTHTYQLEYSAFGSKPATFANRRLSVAAR